MDKLRKKMKHSGHDEGYSLKCNRDFGENKNNN